VVLATMALVCTVWAGKDKEEPQLRLELDLVDGSHIIGTPSLSSVPVQTSYAKIDVPLTQIVTVLIDKDHETASLSLQNGDKLKGVINLEPIELDTAFGKVSVGVEHIRELRVVLSGGRVSDVLKEGLVFYYSFDRDEGGKVTDKSGNGHDGEVCDAIWTPNGKIGGAYQVGKQVGPIYRRRGMAPPKWGTAPPGGGGAYQVGHIQAPDNDAWSFGTKPFSICLWFKFSAPPAGEQDFIGHNEGLGERSKWAFQMQNGNLDFHINNPRRENYRIAAYPWSPQTDRYYHLSVTRNGDEYSIYVDGIRVSTDTNTLPIPVAKAPLSIGQAEGLYVEGVIDEVMILNRALSDSEVQQIYAAQR